MWPTVVVVATLTVYATSSLVLILISEGNIEEETANKGSMVVFKNKKSTNLLGNRVVMGGGGRASPAPSLF
jgi:hypothetical protein